MSEAKILIYDIETSPILGYTWGVYNTNVIEVVSDWHIICFAYKWLGKKKTHFVANWHYGDPKDDLEVVKRLNELFDEADIIVAHNGNKFDQKKCNAKFWEYGLPAPSHYHQVDTLKAARGKFKNTSNRLDALLKKKGFDGKVQHEGFLSMYKGIINNDKKSMKTMEKYNIQDVVGLENLYLDMRQWISNHPNVGMYVDEASYSCPTCGSTSLQKRGYIKRKTNKAQRYRCNDCGSWSHSKQSEKSNVMLKN